MAGTQAVSYRAEPVLDNGGLADVRLAVDDRVWHLAGRGGPQAEAVRALAAAGGDAPVIFLGSGLGAGIAAVLEAGAGPVLVVDKETAIMAATGAKERFSHDPRLAWIDEPQAGPALEAARTWLAGQGGGPARLAVHPVYARLDPGYYRAIETGLSAPAASGPSPLRAARTTTAGRPRLPRVLLLTSKYFLMGEIMTACDRLGAPHKLVSVPEEEAEAGDYAAQMLAAVDELRPDFVLTTNHMGVDREGVLAHLLARLGIPLASWFVDNPHLVLEAYGHATLATTVVFSWDEDQVESLRAMGFAAVHYLPLACDEVRFAPMADLPARHPFRSDVSFLGNSMAIKSRLRLEAADPPPRLRAAHRDLAAAFALAKDQSVEACLRRAFPALVPEYEALDTVDRRLAFDTLIMWEATGQYRLECVSRLLPFRPLIAGDPGWLDILPGEGRDWRYHKELAYYNEAPLFYPMASVNFNATSRQMKGAVNQRVFDVPACGAFLLTDAQAQLDALFEPGSEVAVYADPGEIAELTRFYLDHPTQRQAIAARGRARVLAEHTYARRLSRLFALMRQFG